MRIFTIALLFALLSAFACKTTSSSISQDETVIYLVRHAEKDDDGTRNPPLTEEGHARATRLAGLLKDEGITKVFSTDYLRTKHTAMPLAAALGLEVELYDPRKPDEFAAQLKQMNGQSILIAGHSNSTPTLTNKILGEMKYQQLSEKEYGKIFKVVISSGQMTSKVMEY